MKNFFIVCLISILFGIGFGLYNFLCPKGKTSSSVRMSIVFACSDSYVPHVGTAMTSILLNADKDDKFDFYILQDDISEENKQKFEELKKIKDFNIKFIQVDKERFKDLRILRHSVYTYYRYVIPELISVKKVLYLDTDIIVLNTLKELYNTDISTVYVAAVTDPLNPRLTEYGIKRYFNSGVLLLNLDKMRKDNITEKLFQKTKEIQNEAFFKFSDQDVLNIVFKDSNLYLSKKWNYFNNFVAPIDFAILHFNGSKKPWKQRIFKDIYYWYYRLKTPWIN